MSNCYNGHMVNNNNMQNRLLLWDYSILTSSKPILISNCRFFISWWYVAVVYHVTIVAIWHCWRNFGLFGNRPRATDCRYIPENWLNRVSELVCLSAVSTARERGLELMVSSGGRPDIRSRFAASAHTLALTPTFADLSIQFGGFAFL